MLNIKQKLVKALKELCLKVTGKKSIKNTIYEVLEDITKNYNGASIAYVNSLMDAAVKRVIVTALPTENIDTNTIYMILDSESTLPSNVYNEYMYIESNWELIGTTQIPTYTAGNNVSIVDGVISATDTTYTAGNGITIENGVISSQASAQHLYKHSIFFMNINYKVRVDIFTQSDTEITKQTFASILLNMGYGSSKPLDIEYNDIYVDVNNSKKLLVAIQLYPYGTDIYVNFEQFTFDGDGNISKDAVAAQIIFQPSTITAFADKIIQIL